MRGREFLMKDGYSFDVDFAGARRAYDRMFVAYLRTFARLGLKAIPMQADTGAIGGDLSHEFIILAGTGESEVFCHRELIERDVLETDVDYQDDLAPEVERWTSLYAATDEKHDPAMAQTLGDRLVAARGIEVGHIFYFGTKYSKAMDAFVVGPNDERIYLEMGSYGIGVSRLVGAIIEAYHDDSGIIWPDSVAPFAAAIVNLKTGDEACDRVCEDIYHKLSGSDVDTLYDDREERAGAKFADMDLIGVPWQLVVGPRGLKSGKIEIKRRGSGERQELTVESALAQIVR